MNKLIIFIFIVCLTTSWGSANNQKKRNSFTSFDFSYCDWEKNVFSIKFTSTNKVFVKDHFSQFPSEITMDDETYYSFLSHVDRIKLDSIINDIDFSFYDDTYYEPKTNIQSQLFIEKGSLKKKIYIHNANMPPKLNSLIKWLVTLKKNLKLISVDSSLKFKSLVDFLPPVVKSSIYIIDPKND